MDLKDIPDRWKRYNPETPPYRFMPSRTRQQTTMYSIAAIVGFSALGWLITDYFDRKSDEKAEYYKEYMGKGLSVGEQEAISGQNAAFREIMMRARRKRLGLPDKPPGTVEIRDPD